MSVRTHYEGFHGGEDVVIDWKQVYKKLSCHDENFFLYVPLKPSDVITLDEYGRYIDGLRFIGDNGMIDSNFVTILKHIADAMWCKGGGGNAGCTDCTLHFKNDLGYKCDITFDIISKVVHIEIIHVDMR